MTYAPGIRRRHRPLQRQPARCPLRSRPRALGGVQWTSHADDRAGCGV